MIPPLKHTQRLRLIRDVLPCAWRRAGHWWHGNMDGELEMSTSELRHKTQLIQVRASPEEKAKLKSRAAAFGISMGELCRQVIFSSTPKSKTDQDAIHELAATRADLGRLGGLLKGWLAGSFHQDSPAPKTHADVVALLREIEDAQKRVVAAFTQISGKP